MTPLNNTWVIWYHDQKNDWSINGFKKLYEIKTIEDFWDIYQKLNNYVILKGMFFLMKKDIEPRWETKENINGGCWSYKINKNESFISWLYLSICLCGEQLIKNNNIGNENKNLVNGISISPKKNFCIIKIWNNDNLKTDNSILIDNINNIKLSLCLYKAHKDRN